MSSVDSRIIQFMKRKESQYPELRQSSVQLYRNLVEDEDDLVVTDVHPVRAQKKFVGATYRHTLVGA